MWFPERPANQPTRCMSCKPATFLGISPRDGILGKENTWTKKQSSLSRTHWDEHGE